MWWRTAVLLLLLLGCQTLSPVFSSAAAGRPGQQQIVRVELNKSHLEALRTGEGGWMVICGYKENGRRGRGLWGNTLAETQVITLIPLSRTGDGIEDCGQDTWSPGYDEVVSRVNDERDEEEEAEQTMDSREQEDKEENNKINTGGREDNINTGSREDKTWLTVLLQSLCNIIVFILLPLMTSRGVFGNRAQNMYWRCHQRPVSQRRFLHPPSASASVTNRTRTPQDNNENQYENAMGTEERGDRDNEDGDDHHHHADDGWSDDDDDLLSDEDQHQQESAVSPSVGGVRESGAREISGIGRLGIGRGRGRGGSRHQEQNPQ